MWFWIGLILIVLWGGWGYLRRRWWLREVDRSLGRRNIRELATQIDSGHYQPPSWLALPDRVITAIATAAAVIGLFLVIGSRWGWFV